MFAFKEILALDNPQQLKEAVNRLIPFMVRQAHHERNQPIQRFTKYPFRASN